MNREMRRLQEAEDRRAKKRSRTPQRRRAQQRPGEVKKPLWKRLATFLGEVRIELKRVSWPTRTQMVAFTSVTLITSTAVTLYVFGLDFGFGEAILWLLKRGS